MAEKVLRLHPQRGFFLSGGLHLVNPEKPIVILPEQYQPDESVLTAIKTGVLLDVNQNIASKGKSAEVGPKVTPPAVEDVPSTNDGDVEDEENKTKGRTKGRTK